MPFNKKNSLRNSWKKMTIAESLRQAIREEMTRDKKVFWNKLPYTCKSVRKSGNRGCKYEYPNAK